MAWPRSWREQGAPPIDGQPTSEGFGSLLTRGTVTSQLGGEMKHEWHPEGLIVRLTAPLARLTK